MRGNHRKQKSLPFSRTTRRLRRADTSQLPPPTHTTTTTTKATTTMATMITISNTMRATMLTNTGIMIRTTRKARATIKINIIITSNTNSRLTVDTMAIMGVRTPAINQLPLKVSGRLSSPRPNHARQRRIWTSSSLSLKRRSQSMMLHPHCHRLGSHLSQQSLPRRQRRRQRSNAKLVTTVTKIQVQTTTATTSPKRSHPLPKLNQLEIWRYLSSVTQPRAGQLPEAQWHRERSPTLKRSRHLHKTVTTTTTMQIGCPARRSRSL